jgi:hypothetical protein
MAGTKEEALDYLRSLKKELRSSIAPKGAAMNGEIRKIVAEAKSRSDQKHLRLPEAAFLNAHVVPTLLSHLQRFANLDASQAIEAFRNEYHATMPGTSMGSASHPLKHPFSKIAATNPGVMYKNWHSPKKGDGLTKSFPDFALRDPFPHRILFEGKLFAKGAELAAERELATDLYQTFFYLGLPRVKATKKGQADWNYDYGCLLAFDASKDGTLLGAWNALKPSIRKSFWDNANIYVMILRD